MTTVTIIERFRCAWCGEAEDRAVPMVVSSDGTVTVSLMYSRFCDGCSDTVLANLKRREVYAASHASS